MHAIETKEFYSAEELMAYLRRGNSRWWEPGAQQISWVFRGIWNSEFKLRPSAWREDPDPEFAALREKLAAFPSQFDHPGEELGRLSVLQLNAEFEALCQFADECNSLGFDVPALDGNDRASSSKYLSSLRLGNPNEDDLPEEAYEVAALAQHHGIPTRLLDWTDDPIIGAFFAVDYHFRRGPRPDSICIFALHRKNLQTWNALGKKSETPYTVTREIIGRRARNLFLRSQGGLFIAMKHPASYRRKFHEWPDLENLVRVVADENGFSLPVLKKLTLPVEHADGLLDLVDREGVNRARLMPTLDNVAATIRSRWLYSKGK